MNSQLWAPSRLAFTYYGLWDADELYDLEADPNEMHNLRFDPAYRETVAAMETRLYDMMDELGGCAIPLNRPQATRRTSVYAAAAALKATTSPRPSSSTNRPTATHGKRPKFETPRPNIELVTVSVVPAIPCLPRK